MYRLPRYQTLAMGIYPLAQSQLTLVRTGGQQEPRGSFGILVFTRSELYITGKKYALAKQKIKYERINHRVYLYIISLYYYRTVLSNRDRSKSYVYIIIILILYVLYFYSSIYVSYH